MFCESSAVIQKHSPSVRFCFFFTCAAVCCLLLLLLPPVCVGMPYQSMCAVHCSQPVCVCVFETKAKVVYHVIHTIQTMGICYANMLCRYAKLNGIESNWMSDM